MSVLLIELDCLKSGSFRSSGTVKQEELNFDPNNNFKFYGPVTLDVRVSSTDQLTFYVSGRVSYKASGECRRCLKDVEQDQDCRIRGIFAFPESLEKIATDRESGNVFPLKNGSRAIDLTGLVRECIVLDYPVYILCSEDCKGLCPSCGADLNKKNCKCKQESSDPRWAKLAGLEKRTN